MTGAAAFLCCFLCRADAVSEGVLRRTKRQPLTPRGMAPTKIVKMARIRRRHANPRLNAEPEAV